MIDENNLEKYIKIWNNLDPAIKDFAMDTITFGKKQLRLNQRGMISLLEHLEKHGLEIKTK